VANEADRAVRPGSPDLWLRTVVLVSAAVAAACVASLSSSSAVPVELIAGFLFGTSVLLSRAYSRVSPAVVLLLVYATPGLFVVLFGHNAYSYTVVWLAGLLGLVVGGGRFRSWRLPANWKWALVCWALTLACSWPMVAWREFDLTFPWIWDDRLPVSGAKIAAPGALSWIAFTALTQLLGLLWLDWLFHTYCPVPQGYNRDRFLKETVAPLALGVLTASCVGIYQGVFDIGFMSGHLWPTLRRATGTLMDANVFGTVAGLWTAAFLVIAAGSGLQVIRWGAICGFLATWGGVWTSASRTALLIALVGCTWTATELLLKSFTGPQRRRLLLAGACAVMVLLAALESLPVASTTPVRRIPELISTTSLPAVQSAVRALWERGGYGTAALAMIREHPWLGVGPGSYNVLVHDYAQRLTGTRLSPDNAQNWFRHQFAELGMVGSIGWGSWVAALLLSLRRQRKLNGPGATLRGPIAAFGLASLVGMPGQEPAVVITFWLFVFWYAMDAGIRPEQRASIRASAWLVLCLLAGGYAMATAIPNDLRPPFRAARFGFPYSYGVYSEGPNQVWTAGHGVTVLDATHDWLKLTVWVNHPDADQKPVSVDVWVGHDHVINDRLRRGERVYRHVRLPTSRRFVLEAKVDRTFRPSEHGESSDYRDLGLAMKWEFVERPPG